MPDRDPNFTIRGGDIDRRAFLLASLAAGATVSTSSLAGGSALTMLGAGNGQRRSERGAAEACILIWLRGGVPQTDTWDPKQFTPFRPGMLASELLGTCDSIPTAIDGVRFGAGLEQLASVIDRGAVIRTLVAGSDSGRLSSGTATHHDAEHLLFTGQASCADRLAPTTASLIAEIDGRGDRPLPRSVWIGRGRAPLSVGSSARSSDGAAVPFMVPDPDAPFAALELGPAGGGPDLDRRTRSLAASWTRDAFDLRGESPSLASAYSPPDLDEVGGALDHLTGDIGRRFARGLLLARRLVEHGARVVQVEYPYRPFQGFDLHEDGARRIAALKRQIDRPIATLIRDLETRGLLRRTLVVVASEFGRTVGHARGDESAADDGRTTLALESVRQYGFHDHFSTCSAALLFGGGIRPGVVHGRTAERHPMVPLEDPLTMHELHATILARLGVGGAVDHARSLG